MYQLRWILVLSGLFLCLRSGVAQEVIYSPYEKFDLRSGDFSVIGKVGERTYTYRGGAEGFFLDAYNDSMEKLATVMLDFFPKKIYETRFISYPDKMVVLYQAVENGKVIQYAALLDGAARLLKGPMQLTSAGTGIFGPNRSYFSSAVSEDKRSILIYQAETKKRELNFNGIWLDDQLNIQKRSSARFEAENNPDYGEGILDNEGTFYLTAFTPAGNRNFADQAWLLSLSKEAGRFKVKEFPLFSKFASSLFLKLDYVNNRIYAAGFYSERKNGNLEGVLFAYYDIGNDSWDNRKNIAFDERLRNETGERSKKRAFNDYHIKQMIVKKDGGFVLIAEDFFITNRTSTPGWGGYYYSYYYNPFMSSSVREYHYNDIFVISYNGNGQRDWHAFVRKSQYSIEDGGIFSSYALINTGGMLGFLFNDFNTRNSRIQLASADASGDVQMRSLAAGNTDDPDWLPRSAKQVGLKEVIVPCLRKRQISFAKIVF